MFSVLAGDDLTSSFLTFLAGGGPVLLVCVVCVGVAGRRGKAATAAAGFVRISAVTPDPDSDLFGEYRSRT